MKVIFFFQIITFLLMGCSERSDTAQNNVGAVETEILDVPASAPVEKPELTSDNSEDSETAIGKLPPSEPVINSTNSISVAFAESPMVLRDGQVAWIDGWIPSSVEQAEFDAVTEIFQQLGDVGDDGMKIVIRAEGENKALFVQDPRASSYRYKIIYNPTTGDILRRISSQD
jgi:hypothetical protein